MLNIFKVETKRVVNRRWLSWPHRACNGTYLAGNQFYSDFRRSSWPDAKRALELEQRLVLQLDSTGDPDAVLQNEDEEEIADTLKCLDIGIASTVLALGAARCIPCASCNGGALGGHHHEEYPLVVFFSRSPWVDELMAASASAGVGLENATEGMLMVYSGNLKKMLSFAGEMLTRKRTFNRLKAMTRKQRLRSGCRFHSLIRTGLVPVEI